MTGPVVKGPSGTRPVVTWPLMTLRPPVDRLAWTLFTVTAGAVLAQGALVLTGSASLVDPVTGPNSFPIISAGAVLGSLIGALVATRHPRNPIGWLFLVGQLGLAVGLACQAFGYRVLVDGDLVPRRTGQVVELVSVALDAKWTLSVLAAAFLLFPDGHLPSRRWRPLLWAIPLAEVCTVAGILMVRLDTVAARGLTVPPPAVVSLLDLVSALLSVLLLALATASLFVRRRRSTRVQRQQLRWPTVAALALVAGFALAQYDDSSPWAVVPLFVAYACVPAATGVAILRHRLYDIDIVINRTVVGALAVVFVTVGYVAVVVLVGALVGGQVSQRYWVSVLATAVVAVAFQPVRGQVRRLADRVVYGRRAAPYEALAELSRQLADSVSVEQVLPAVAEAAALGTGAAQITVRLYVPGGEDLVASLPDGGAGNGSRSAPADTTVTVWHGTAQLGEIALTMPRGRRLSAADGALLADIATQAGLGFRTVRLTASLATGIETARSQAAQLEASQRRLLAAQESGRQRLARTVHTEVLPHLDALRQTLKRADGMSDTRAAVALVENGSERVAQALDALREIARGVYPPVLARRGLADALIDYAARHPGRMDLTISGLAAGTRFRRRIELATYFCAVESARALGSVTVDLGVGSGTPGDRVVLSVTANDPTRAFSDDGPGLTDRVEACGGHVMTGPDHAERTRLLVELPIDEDEDEQDDVPAAAAPPDGHPGVQPAAAHSSLSRSGPNADFGT